MSAAMNEMMQEGGVMAVYQCRTEHAVLWGAPREIAVLGAVQACFSDQHKLTLVRLMFDTSR